jgi:hypothetical protein
MCLQGVMTLVLFVVQWTGSHIVYVCVSAYLSEGPPRCTQLTVPLLAGKIPMRELGRGEECNQVGKPT